MTSSQLRELQTPLKQKYKTHPTAALWTITAEAELAVDVTCAVRTYNGTITAGLHPATGGSGSAACSADMLLQALAACAGVTMNSIATVMDFRYRNAQVIAEGDLDFRGTLAVDRDTPVQFMAIRLRFELDSDESEDRQARLIQLTERYCVVYQTLVRGVAVQTLHK